MLQFIKGTVHPNI